MSRWYVALCFLLCTLHVRAQEQADSIVPPDTLQQQPSSEISKLREVVRGFDRLNEDYIEPQHYVLTVMFQGTHTYDRY